MLYMNFVSKKNSLDIDTLFMHNKKAVERKSKKCASNETTNKWGHRNKLKNKLTVLGFSHDIKLRYRLHNVNVIWCWKQFKSFIKWNLCMDRFHFYWLTQILKKKCFIISISGCFKKCNSCRWTFSRNYQYLFFSEQRKKLIILNGINAKKKENSLRC